MRKLKHKISLMIHIGISLLEIKWTKYFQYDACKLLYYTIRSKTQQQIKVIETALLLNLSQ